MFVMLDVLLNNSLYNGLSAGETNTYILKSRPILFCLLLS